MVAPKHDGGLGFHDLESFNLALLAKQLWQIIYKPNSLVAMAFKESYFKNNNILKASERGNVSMIWQSLIVARRIIHASARWRLKNGSSIKILKDKWIPTVTTFKFKYPISMLHEDAYVHELLQEAYREWNTNLVQMLFWKEEAQTILSIPLGVQSKLDKLIWGLSTNGSFLVKSAYRAPLTIKKDNTCEVSNSEARANHWKLIWSLAISEKVKNFLWKHNTNTTLTNNNLLKKNVVESRNSPLYLNEEETMIHIVWNCKVVSNVWANSNLPTHKWPSILYDIN